MKESMSTDSDNLAAIEAAFESIIRPEHFTNFGHCEECLEHDETLLSVGREQLTLKHLGMPGWDPVTFCTPEGKAYLLPALARLALNEPDEEYGWYGPQFLNHLYSAYEYNDLWQYCNDGQKKVVACLILHLINSRAGLIDSYLCADEFLRCYELWSTPPNSASCVAHLI
jgi:hypothetical protein